MAKDGLSTDFQGVEGHGEAQIFGPSQTVGQFDAYMREASQDRERRKAELALESAKLGQVSTEKIWDKEQNYFIEATQGLLRQTADFEKKYASNPKLVNTQEYFKDKLAIQKEQSRIDFEAQSSTQRGEMYKGLNTKYNSDTDIYDNPKNNEQLGKVLAEQDLTKRGEMLRTLRLHKNWDINKSLDEAAKSIGDFLVSKESGMTTTETKNARFDDKGKSTEYGLLEADAIKQYLDTKDGQRSIEEVIEQKGAKNLGRDAEEITRNAGIEVAKMIMARRDQSLKISQNEPRAASADEKKVQTAIPAQGKVIGFSVPVVKGGGVGQEGDIVKQAVDKTTKKPLSVQQEKDGTYTYWNDKNEEVPKANVEEKNVTTKVKATMVDGKTWGTPIMTTYAAPFVIEMDESGSSTLVEGTTDFLISGYGKMNYFEGKDGKIQILSDKALPERKKKGGVKQGWFAISSVKANAGSDQVANDKPRFIPLTQDLYQINQKNLNGVDIPENELWDSSGKNKNQQEKTTKLASNEKLFKDPKSGRMVVVDINTNKPIRWAE